MDVGYGVHRRDGGADRGVLVAETLSLLVVARPLPRLDYYLANDCGLRLRPPGQFFNCDSVLATVTVF